MPDRRAEGSENRDDRLVTKSSPWSVSDTVARLSAVVAARGMTLFAVIDHSGEAAASGLELRDTKVVIFGQPAGRNAGDGRRAARRTRSSAQGSRVG